MQNLSARAQYLQLDKHPIIAIMSIGIIEIVPRSQALKLPQISWIEISA